MPSDISHMKTLQELANKENFYLTLNGNTFILKYISILGIKSIVNLNFISSALSYKNAILRV